MVSLPCGWAARPRSFFGFLNVFPCSARRWMLNALQSLHIPESVIVIIEQIYDDGNYLMLLGGVLPTIGVASGIKRRCPMRGSIFALCIDPLLRRFLVRSLVGLTKACRLTLAISRWSSPAFGRTSHASRRTSPSRLRRRASARTSGIVSLCLFAVLSTQSGRPGGHPLQHISHGRERLVHEAAVPPRSCRMLHGLHLRRRRLHRT